MRRSRLKIVHAISLVLVFSAAYVTYVYYQFLGAFTVRVLDCAKGIYLNSINPFVRWLFSQEYDFAFNSRETAIGIVFLSLMVLVCLNKGIRVSIVELLGCLFNRHFNRVYIEITLYTLLMIYVLFKQNLWEFRYTKDTLLWIFFSALYLSFKTAVTTTP